MRMHVAEQIRKERLKGHYKQDLATWGVTQGRRTEGTVGLQDTQQTGAKNQVWEDIRVARPQVVRCSLLWFSNCIPKHAFILWLAIRHKLQT